MYRALYDYKSSLSDYLCFEIGDRFTLIGDDKSKQCHKDWLLAQNGIGQVGYVPYNYIDSIPCTESEVVKFIDGSIAAIHLQAASNDENYTPVSRGNLKKLLEHRAAYLDSVKHDEVAVEKRQHKRHAPAPPLPVNQVSRKSSSGKKAPPPPPTRDSSLGVNGMKSPVSVSPASNDEASLHNKSPDVAVPNIGDECVTIDISDVRPMSPPNSPPNSPPQSTFQIETSPVRSLPVSPTSFDSPSPLVPTTIGPELIEQIRINTGLSFDKSKVALETVLGYIGFKIPELSSSMDEIFKTTENAKQTGGDFSSRDAKRLEVIFSELAACKDDSQQRSWALHEDEAIITEYLEELNSILENAKKSICCKVISEENYECVLNLVQYYQMETRVSIRLLLLKSFGGLCGLDKGVITVLLCSVLPLELAEDVKSKPEEVQRLSYASLVLCMIFSTGEQVPSNMHEHLNEEFVAFVLDLVENPMSLEHEDQATDLLVGVILAYNLHIHPEEPNLIMNVLADKGTVKTFTEKVMLLLNRGDDPVNIFNHKPSPKNSVIKFFQDLYSAERTANLLYTNDAMVLIDILIRQLSDLSSGDPLRSEFLILTNSLIRNSDYEEHRHRNKELRVLFKSIEAEEMPVECDKAIVCGLLNSYPHIF